MLSGQAVSQPGHAGVTGAAAAGHAVGPATTRATAARRAVQGTLDELGTPLADVTFVVVDLETTGGDPARHRITEIGAVKVRGGVVLGEFATLVDPGEPIPAFISVLTGITDAMVAGAPRIEAVLPAFLEFAVGSVLVAHNAPFDIGFLRTAAARLDLRWAACAVIDTVPLARRLVTREEAPDHKLASLARLFVASTTPDHRALHDARATVDVLHGLLERVGSLGVLTLEELRAFASEVTPAQRRKRHLADSLPSAPGVYLFADGQGRVLYVGTSRDLRRRVRSYFTASEQRARVREMLRLAQSVTPVVCETALGAQVRELRLIAEHDPPYNRRSRRPMRAPWIKLTPETFPRLSIVRQVRPDGGVYAGPFGSVHAATAAIEALHEVLALRRCTTRLSPRHLGSACVLADLGRCGAPCEGRQSAGDYARIVAAATGMLVGDGRTVVTALAARLTRLAAQERYEEAARERDRAAALVQACDRSQAAAALAVLEELVAARRRPGGGWEVVCVRHGRLAGTTLTPRGADPMPFIDGLVATAESVSAPAAPAAAAHPDETRLVHAWLGGAGVRLVRVDAAGWSCPVHGAGSARSRFRAGSPGVADRPVAGKPVAGRSVAGRSTVTG